MYRVRDVTSSMRTRRSLSTHTTSTVARERVIQDNIVGFVQYVINRAGSNYLKQSYYPFLDNRCVLRNQIAYKKEQIVYAGHGLPFEKTPEFRSSLHSNNTPPAFSMAPELFFTPTIQGAQLCIRTL